MKIDTSTWKTFGFTEIFEVCKGFYNKKPEPSGEGTISFLSATSDNNGVTEHYTLEEIANATRTGDGHNDPLSRKLFPGHAVCVTNNGSVGFAYYQAEQFTCSHDVNPLYRLDGEFTEATGLFVASVIMKDRYRWAYGRKWRPERMVHSTVDLPATPDGKPDWQWMESYINSLHSEPLKTSNGSKAALGTFVFDIREWHEFRVEELFDSIYKVASYDDSELERVDMWGKKTVPYVTRTDLDNSVKSLVSSAGLANIEAGNAIVIGDTTSTISYQPGPFVAGEHIIAARADWMNKYTGLFITCLLRQERYRYSYGRAYKLDSIRNTELRLPVTSDGIPDWQWMENYIKSLPYGDRL